MLTYYVVTLFCMVCRLRYKISLAYPDNKCNFLIFLVFFCFSACNSQENAENNTAKQDTIKSIQKPINQKDTPSESERIQEEIAKEFLPDGLTFQQVEDTLKKLANIDSISLYNNSFSLDIGKVNGIKYAFIASHNNQSKELHHYLHKDNKWVKMYHIPYKEGSFYMVKKIDINQDKYKDLAVITHTRGTGNKMPNIFLYNPQKNQFVYKKYLSIPNMEINIADSLITSHWFALSCHTSNKNLYKWQADSVLLLESYEIIPDCGGNENFSAIKHYRNENGKISESTKTYKTEKAWDIFDKAVFEMKK